LIAVPATALPVLTRDAVQLGRTAVDKVDAIRQTGQVLLDVGAVEPAYVDAMLQREISVSTYVGEAVAIPHGTNESRSLVRRTAIVVVQFPDGVDWDGAPVQLCIGIAARGDEQVGVLAALARILLMPEQAHQLRTATSPDDVIALLSSTEETD
jgi:mannitol/fructose-specific phosphotransferase system IIA component